MAFYGNLHNMYDLFNKYSRFSFFRPKVTSPPQDILLKLEKEKTYNELSEESSMSVFKLGLYKLKTCLLLNGLVFDSSEVMLLLFYYKFTTALVFLSL